MLNLDVDEQTARKISGHAQGSLEFYKYVKYNQQQVCYNQQKVVKHSRNVRQFFLTNKSIAHG